MYTRQEASLIRKKFWTSFGLYMRPVHGAEGDTVNWLNYKTGIRHIYFRMDADNQHVSVAIELAHPDADTRLLYYEQLHALRTVFTEMMGEEWDWQSRITDEHGTVISRISKTLSGVSIFDESRWPDMISFLKPRMIALDNFWLMVKDGFD